MNALANALANARARACAVVAGALAGALAAAPPLRALGAQPPDAATVVVRGQRLDPGGAVRVWNLLGSVRVVGWAHDSVALTARTRGAARVLFGGSAQGVKVGIEERGGAPAPAEVELRVPYGARVWVKTSTATIATAGLTREVELYSVSGAVRVTGRPATLRVESLAGTVAVRDGAAWVRARTGSGTLDVRGAVGDAELSTVGGALRLTGDVGQRARVESVTGTVRVTGAVARGAQLEIDTNGGDVTLDPGGGDVALDLHTLNGRITSARPAVRRAVHARGAGQAAVTAGASPEAGRIEVRSFRGAIVVDHGASRRAVP